MDAEIGPTNVSSRLTLGQLLDIYIDDRPYARPETCQLFAAVTKAHFADWRDLHPEDLTVDVLADRWGVVLSKVAGRTKGNGKAMTLLAFGVLASACREGLDRHLLKEPPPVIDFVRERRRLYRAREGALAGR